MNLSSHTDATQHTAKSRARTRLDTFPLDSLFTTEEQMQRFELLRLAFFVLKLRKLNEQQALIITDEQTQAREREISFQRNLLRHVIFQQIVTLTALDAREQAMHIISTGHCSPTQ